MDRDEQSALEPFEDELRELRTRHAADPPLEVLRAATGEVLPEDLQASTSAHLENSRWSRALVEGTLEVGELSSAAEARLLERITREGGRAARPPASSRASMWWSLVGAAGVAALVAVMVWPSGKPPADANLTTKPAGPTSAPTPVTFALSLDKPAMKLSPRAFTYRGAAGDNEFAAQLKPAFDAMRQDDYPKANDAFTALARTYPDTVEIPFYQGVSRLFMNDFSGADTSLAAAEQADRGADGSFAPDIAWYRAIVDERLGRIADARARLTALCGQANARQTTACEAAGRLK